MHASINSRPGLLSGLRSFLLSIKYKVTRRLVVFGFLCLSQQSVACDFSLNPVFGADWYNQFIFNSFYSSNALNSLGILTHQRKFQRTFSVNTSANVYQLQTLGETISDQTFFYQFYIRPRIQIQISTAQTTIRTNAVGEQEGPIGLSSSSDNQLGLSCDYLIRSILIKSWDASFHISAGGNTTLNARNTFNTQIDWIKLYPEEISPRMIAGSYKTNIVLGAAAIVQKGNINMLSSIGTRMFTPNADGFVFGNDLNVSVNMGYGLHVPHMEIRLEPQLGINFEHGNSDWLKASSTKDPTTLARGQDLLLSAGGQLKIRNLNVSFSYLSPLWENGFPSYQLCNTSQFVLATRYCF